MKHLRTLLIAIAVIASGLVVPATPAHAAPDIEVIAAHPRLIARRSGFDALAAKVRTDPVSARYSAGLIAEADRILGQAPVTDSSSSVLGDVPSTVLHRVQALAMAHRLTGQARYQDRLRAEVEAVLGFESWHPERFLSAAQLGYAMALAYDWQYDQWTASQRSTLRNRLTTEVLRPGLLELQRSSDEPPASALSGGWSRERNNRNVVINSCLLMVALAISGETSGDEPRQILDASVASLDFGLQIYLADGGVGEGPSYWEFATTHLVMALTSLRTAANQDAGLLAKVDLRRTTRFILNMTSQDGVLYSYADSDTSIDSSVAEAGVARLIGDPAIEAHAAAGGSSSRLAAAKLLWRDPDVAGSAAAMDTFLGDHVYDSVGISTMRGTIPALDAFAAMKYKEQPGLGHQHLDLGDVDYQAIGVDWISTLPWDRLTYSSPEQETQDPDRRSDYYRVDTEGHNTLLTNPFERTRSAPDGPTTVVGSHSSTSSAWTIADLTATSRQLTSWRRGIRLDKTDGSLLIQDEVRSSTTDFLWSVHTGADVQIAADGRSAVLHQDGRRLLAQLAAPGTARFQSLPAAPLPTSPQLEQTANTGLSRLSVLVEGATSTTIAVRLTPLALQESATRAQPAVDRLADWSSPASHDGTLSRLTVDGTALADFDPKQRSYQVTTAGSAPTVAATAADGGAVQITQAATVPGTAEIRLIRGGATSSYLVRFERAAIRATSATASQTSRGAPGNTIDGNESTGWAAKGTQTLTLTQAASATVRALTVAWTANPARQLSLGVATSADGTSWTPRLTDTLTGPSSTRTLVLDDGPASTRVRITVRGDGSATSESVLREIGLLAESPDPSPGRRSTPAISFVDPPSTLSPGESRRLTLNRSPSSPAPDRVRLLSSDPAIATVVDGQVVGVARGTVRVAAIAEYGRTSTFASAQLTVVNPYRVRLEAVEDSYVEGGTQAGLNNGTAYRLDIKPPDATTPASGTRVRYSYLRFDLGALPAGVVRSAVLGLNGQLIEGADDASVRIDTHAVSNSWSERTVTYDNRPDLGAVVGSTVFTRTAAERATDVTSYVRAQRSGGASAVSLGLTRSAANGTAMMVRLSSRETREKPYLDVLVTPPAAPLTAATASATLRGLPGNTIDGSADSWTAQGTQTLTLTQERTEFVGALEVSWIANSARKLSYAIDTGVDGQGWTRRASGTLTGESAVRTVTLDPGGVSNRIRITVSGDGSADSESEIREVVARRAQLEGPPVVPDLLSSVALQQPPTVRLKQSVQVSARAVTLSGDQPSGTRWRYSVADPAIATVSASGVLTGGSVGTTTLSVWASVDGITATATATVAVQDPTRVRLYPTADTYVEGGPSLSGSNFGTAYRLDVKPPDSTTPASGTRVRYSYLAFDLSGLDPGTVTSAVLNLEGQLLEGADDATVRIDAQAVTGSWTETGTTYANRPSLGAVVGSAVYSRTNSYRTTDVTAHLDSIRRANGTSVSLGLTKSAANGSAMMVRFSSRETSRKPFLDIVINPAPIAVRSVEASSTTRGRAANTIDGNESTGWATKGEQTITFTQERRALVTGLTLSWSANPARTIGYDVESSDDGGATWFPRRSSTYRGPSGTETISLDPGPESTQLRLTVRGDGTPDSESLLREITLLATPD